MKIPVAKSGQYLLYTSGLRLGSFCLGAEATAGMQEAGITGNGICKENGRPSQGEEENVISPLVPVSQPTQHHCQEPQ